MTERTLIKNISIINEGKIIVTDLLLDNGIILYAGSGIAAAMCTPYWSKQTMIVNKICEQNGVYWVRGTIGSKRIEFVVEGAIDNNEVYL